MSRAATFDDLYMPNKWMPFGAALGFHFMLLVWNPTLMSGNALHPAPEIMQVRYEDKLPPIMEVKKPEPVKPKHVEKKVKRAHKSGLSLTKHHEPIPVTRHAAVARPQPVHKPFVSKITMPKFVPHMSDESIAAASPSPGISAPSPHKMVQAFTPAPKLRAKTRGVRASDINFELSDRGSLAAGGGAVVAIPVGEERGEIASLPNAAVLHNAPKGAKTVAGYRFQPGNGVGSGELAGRDRKGFAPGYHGAIQSDEYVEGSLSGGGGKGKGTQIGHGFEIGGPVGDRKVLKRKLPEYPDWAEEKGISAMVKIYFTVKPDGSLRSSMRIVTSSGYTELDSLAKEALQAWRFSPTSASSSEQEAWGVITFRFTLA